MAGSSSRALEESVEESKPKSRTVSKRETSHLKPKVTFESQTWSISSPRTRKSTTATPTKRASSDPTDSRSVTKRQSRLASLFISLLAVSPMAVEYDAADQKTVEAAQKASTQPTAPKKPYMRPVRCVRPSEIRKTRWKRFKYEVGLKMKGRHDRKGKERNKWMQIEDAELEVLNDEERDRQNAKRDDMT